MSDHKKARVEELKQTIIKFLNTCDGKRYPYKDFWSAIERFQKKPLSHKLYGVSKMKKLLEKFQDVLVYGNDFITLKSDLPIREEKLIISESSQSEFSITEHSISDQDSVHDIPQHQREKEIPVKLDTISGDVGSFQENSLFILRSVGGKCTVNKFLDCYAKNFRGSGGEIVRQLHNHSDIFSLNGDLITLTSQYQTMSQNQSTSFSNLSTWGLAKQDSSVLTSPAVGRFGTSGQAPHIAYSLPVLLPTYQASAAQPMPLQPLNLLATNPIRKTNLPATALHRKLSSDNKPQLHQLIPPTAQPLPAQQPVKQSQPKNALMFPSNVQMTGKDTPPVKPKHKETLSNSDWQSLQERSEHKPQAKSKNERLVTQIIYPTPSLQSQQPSADYQQELPSFSLSPSKATSSVEPTPIRSTLEKESMKEWPVKAAKSGQKQKPGIKIEDDGMREVIIKQITLPKGSRLSSDFVNSQINECIEVLSEANEHVSLERVEDMVLKKFKVKRFSDLNLSAREFMKMPAAFEHSRAMCRVNQYIQSFVRNRSLCTLHELQECCREFHPEGKDFKHLRLGPLQKMPLINEQFRFPMDEYIPEINSADIIEHLHNYMNKKKLWTEKVQLEDFMHYLMETYSIDNPFSLGVVLRSLPLVIQMLKKSQRDANASRKNVSESLMECLTSDIHDAFKLFRASILKNGKEGNELRLHYMGLAPEEVLKEILAKYELLACVYKTSNPRTIEKALKIINNFLKRVLKIPLPRQLFHLSVCLSSLQMEECAMAFLEAESKHQQQESQPIAKKVAPTKVSLTEKVNQYLNKCLEQGALKLSHLERIETKVLEDFDFSAFQEMGYGTFLKFIHSEAKINKVLEECGGTLLGSSHDNDSIFKPILLELLELLCQTKLAGIVQMESKEICIREQYHVANVKQLGHGDITRLCNTAEKHGKHISGEYNTYYEAVLCGKSCPETFIKDSVGLIGFVTKEAAFACLTACPLLEDMAEWSHWSLVFQPQLGRLKEFIKTHGGQKEIDLEGGKKIGLSDFKALEVEPGKLLKVASCPSVDHFCQALEKLDPYEAAGQLVSLIVANKGLDNTPLALLANHLKNTLILLHAQRTPGITPGGPPAKDVVDDLAVQFVTSMLLRLPVRICVAVANQVLLTPLGDVVGSAKSKKEIILACTLPHQRRHLELLGCLIGLPEWAASYQSRLVFPASCVEDKEPDELQDSFIDDEDDDDDDDEDQLEEEKFESDSEIDEMLAAVNREEISTKSDYDVSTEKITESSAAEITVCFDENKMPDITPMEDIVSSGNYNSNESLPDNTAEATVKSCGESRNSDTDVENNDGPEMDKIPEEVTCAETEGQELTQEEKCQLIVEDIRREEFGVGIKLDETGQKLMQKQQERQGRSLQRLSRDLYSKETHFVLELIQNADDNSYSKGVNPSIKFVIDHSGVKVLNNEQGFEEKNIRAICDVGKSTKSKHLYGYIGQKGIGFKSVFRVTSCPEVHSNGFHIYFDVNSGPMGYILPHWKEDPIIDENWQTQIILPWTEEIKRQVRTHAARFNDIQPSLLLFLHRLKEITIENKVEGLEMSMKRQDFDNGEIQITHSHGVDRWLVLRKILDASNISLQAKSGVEVVSTEIALAFPLKGKQFLKNAQIKPEKLPVFAFLPLRSYGFRFIVQGDFDVPSSREDVDRDSSWNQWIRNEIHVLFIEALETFKAREDLTPVEAIIQYLQFVPFEGEVMGFFKPVATQILDQLKAKECMPVLNVDRKTIQWKMPSKTVITYDALVLEVASPEVLHQHLDLNYLHPDVAAVISEPLTRSLGIKAITMEHLLHIGRSLSHQWENSDNVSGIAKWLACVYRSLDDFQDNSEILTQLRKMKIVPLSSGCLVSLSDVTVFMLADNQDEQNKNQNQEKDPLLNLRKDLNILHSSLISTADNEVNSQVVKLLLNLGIKQLTAHDLIYSHILPVFKSEAWKEKKKEVLVSYLVYIKSELDKNSSIVDVSELSVVKLLTNHGIKSPADYVHFPTAFGNELNLEFNFPGLDWTLVDTGYLPVHPSLHDRQSWHKFLGKLGVTDFLTVTKEELTFDKNSIHETVWSAMKEIWPESLDGYAVTDFQCEEFYRLVTANKQPEKLIPQMAKLFEYLDILWDQEYNKFVHTQLRSGSGQFLRDMIPTSFACYLQSLPWVITDSSTVLYDEDSKTVRVEAKENLGLPSDLYLPDSNIKRFLNHTVKYLYTPSYQSSKFIRLLNIKSNIPPDAIKTSIISWGQRHKDFPEKPTVFCTTQWHTIELYKYINEEMAGKECQDLFHNEPVIFVPIPGQTIFKKHYKEGCRLEDEFTAYWMMRREEVWWSDPTGLVSKYMSSLEKYNSPLSKFKLLKDTYGHMEEMLSRNVRPEKEPSTIQYAQLLVHIATVFSLSEDGVLSDTLILFSKIGKDLSKISTKAAEVKTMEAMKAEINLPKVMEHLSKAAVFPTKLGQWVKLSDSPMVPDSKEFEEMFINLPGVHLLNTEMDHATSPATNKVDAKGMKHLISLFPDIKPLSECVTLKEITPGFQQCNKGQTYLHNVVGLIQRFLYHSFPQVYSLFKSRKSATLKDLIFVQVDSLEVRYELTFDPEVHVIREEKCVFKENCLYFHVNYVDSHTEINKELAKYFSEGDERCYRELRGFLMQADVILDQRSDETIDDLFVRQLPKGSSLPSSEEVWEVPLPIIPVLPEPEPEMFYGHQSSAENFVEGEDQEKELQGLRSWPPRKGIDTEEGSRVKKDPNKSSTIWPPPEEAPSKTNAKKLPSNIKFEEDSDSAQTSKDNDVIAKIVDAVEKNRSSQHFSRQPSQSSEDKSGHTISHQVSSDLAGMKLNRSEQTQTGDSTTLDPDSRRGNRSGQPPPSVDQPYQSADISGPKHHKTGQPLQDLEAVGETKTAQTSSEESQVLNNRMVPGENSQKEFSGIKINHDGGLRKLLHFSIPSWNDNNEDLVYSELACADSLILPLLELDSGAQDRETTGQWGEQLVNNYLQHQKELNKSIQSVIWVNTDAERGLPYDFVLNISESDSLSTIYIEVKSTKSWDKEVFHISSNQIEFALDQKDHFEIYRVYGAGSRKAKLVRIENVAEKMRVKQVQVLMVI